MCNEPIETSNLEFLLTVTRILQVSFANVVAPLAELDALQFPLVQACVLPRMVSPSEDVRKASAEAEKRLDSHFALCRLLISCPFTWIQLWGADVCPLTENRVTLGTTAK